MKISTILDHIIWRCRSFSAATTGIGIKCAGSSSLFALLLRWRLPTAGVRSSELREARLCGDGLQEALGRRSGGGRRQGQDLRFDDAVAGAGAALLMGKSDYALWSQFSQARRRGARPPFPSIPRSSQRSD